MTNSAKILHNLIFIHSIGSAQLEYGGEVINVNRYIQHKLFDPYSFDYDYSLLELKTPIIFDSAAKAPISLPSSNDVIVDSSAVFVSGWGTTEFDPNKASPILRAVTVNMINYNQCEEIYRDFGGLTVQMICAKSYKKDSCQGWAEEWNNMKKCELNNDGIFYILATLVVQWPISMES